MIEKNNSTAMPQQTASFKHKAEKFFLFTCDTELAGPGSEHGPEMFLRLFDKFNIKATFFITWAFLSKYPHIVGKILKKKHEVASHGYTHPDPEPDGTLPTYLPDWRPEKISEEIHKSYQLFHDSGIPVAGFRAPKLKSSIKVLKETAKYFRYDSSFVAKTFFDNTYGIIEIPITGLTIFKIPFASSYMLNFPIIGKSFFNILFKTKKNMVFYSHSFDLSDFKLFWTVKWFKKRYYYKHCGTNKAHRFYDMLISTALSKGYKFITCSEFCDLTEQ